jgi:two-component system phosphate regulon response regulator PhoB
MKITIGAEASKFREQIEGLLREQQYGVALVEKLGGALEALRAAPPELLVLGDPFLNGGLAEFLRAIRAEARLRGLPVLCVGPTASVDVAVTSLDAGADDFIHRPFNAQIFLARVRTLLRRRAPEDGSEDAVTVVRSGPIHVKLLSRQAFADDKPLLLTRLEFDLLAYLARHVDQVFKRDELLAAVWNYPGNVETRTLDKHVEALRKKLGSSAACIETIHGVGYRFLVPARRAGR